MSFDAALLSRIEDAGINASAPPQQRWLDGWLVRFSPGKAKRARCINAVAEGRLPLEQKLALARAIYEAARLPLVIRVTRFSLPAGLDAQLEQLGYERLDDTRVMVLGDLAGIATPVPVAGLEVRSIGLEPFAHRIGAFRGSPLAQRQAHGERLANSPVPFHAFELWIEGEVVACGQYAIEADLVGLYDIYTAEGARNQGHASMLCRSLLFAAQAQGARVGYLQVEADNDPARAAYHRLGFADAYSYHYRIPAIAAERALTSETPAN